MGEAVRETRKEGEIMARFIVLCRYTQRGIEHIQGSPGRMTAFKADAKAKGAEMIESYLVSGRFDLIHIFEAPDDETMAKVAISLGSHGNVTTETMRAFTEAELKKIIGGL